MASPLEHCPEPSLAASSPLSFLPDVITELRKEREKGLDYFYLSLFFSVDYEVFVLPHFSLCTLQGTDGSSQTS